MESAKEKFKIGDRVRVTAEYVHDHPGRIRVPGRVVGFSRLDDHVRITRDGRQFPETWYMGFWEVASPGEVPDVSPTTEFKFCSHCGLRYAVRIGLRAYKSHTCATCYGYIATPESGDESA